MIQLSQRHRETACEFHDGRLTALYGVCHTGKVSERNVPLLIEEVRMAMNEAKDAEMWDSYNRLHELLNEVVVYDTFEFLGE